MVAVNCPCALEFDDYSVTDNQVGSKHANWLSAEPNFHRLFSLNSQSFFHQGDDHGFAIDGFQEAVSKLIEYVVESADDDVG